MSGYSQYTYYSQVESTYFRLRMLPNFDLRVSGHFVIKNSPYKKRKKLHIFIAFSNK